MKLWMPAIVALGLAAIGSAPRGRPATPEAALSGPVALAGTLPYGAVGSLNCAPSRLGERRPLDPDAQPPGLAARAAAPRPDEALGGGRIGDWWRQHHQEIVDIAGCFATGVGIGYFIAAGGGIGLGIALIAGALACT